MARLGYRAQEGQFLRIRPLAAGRAAQVLDLLPVTNDAVFCLRLPKAELEHWRQLAQECGVSLSAWIRYQCSDQRILDDEVDVR